MRQQGYRFSLDTLPEPEEAPVSKPSVLMHQANGSLLN
jgi:hypothetical protein